MAADLQTIKRLRVPVIVRIGRRRSTVDETLSLNPGAILELPKHADEELELLINNKPIGRGSAVKVGENFGLRIHKVGSARQRVEALGSDQADPPPPSPESAPPSESSPASDA